MDAISMLKDDHRTVERLFKRFEKAGDRAYAEKREVVDRIIEALSVHAAVEELLFYPVTRATVPKTEDVALESLEEHHLVKWTLSELQGMDPKDERFDAKVTVLIEHVRHHVKEEEGDYFPKVRDELGRAALGDLGEAMEAARLTAPTHPHPRSPDTPPGNLLAGPAAGVVDRMGDTVSGLAQGGASVVGDVVARVLGRKRPRTSPRGTTAARRTASKVRASGNEATEKVIETVRDAQRSARSEARKTRPTTKRTAKKAGTRAKTTTKRTATTAKRTAKKASTRARTTTARGRTAAKRTTAAARRRSR
jgi:hemerythrin superfamily protein